MSNITITQVTNTTVVLGGRIEKVESVAFAGADVFAKGTVMARNTSTKKIVPWANAGANGTNVPVGVLDVEVTATGAGNIDAPIVKAGIVDGAKLIEDGVGAVTDVLYYDALQANSGITVVEVTEA